VSFGLGVTKFGPWLKTQNILKANMRPVYRALGAAWRVEAQRLKDQLGKGIQSQAPGGQAFKPLSPTTLAVRRFLGFRGTKALLWHRNLLRAIKVTPSGRSGSSNYQVFVGIHSSARDPQGKSLYVIGLTHENGRRLVAVRLTPKLCRFLGAVFASMNKGASTGVDRPWWLTKSKGRGVLMISIPARPVFRPIWGKYGKETGARIVASVQADLKGTLSA